MAKPIQIQMMNLTTSWYQERTGLHAREPFYPFSTRRKHSFCQFCIDKYVLRPAEQPAQSVICQKLCWGNRGIFGHSFECNKCGFSIRTKRHSFVHVVLLPWSKWHFRIVYTREWRRQTTKINRQESYLQRSHMQIRLYSIHTKLRHFGIIREVRVRVLCALNKTKRYRYLSAINFGNWYAVEMSN